MNIMKGSYTVDASSFFRGSLTFQFKKYGIFYLFIVTGGCFFLIKQLFQLRTNFQPLEDEFSQGSMEWTTVEDIEAQYEIVPVHPFKEEDYFEGKPGLPISRLPRNALEKRTGTFRYAVETSIGNMAIVAATRIGKSRYFIDPFLDTISRAKEQLYRWSFIMTCTKGTEPREWYETLKQRGYTVRIYNTVNQFYSDPFPMLKIFFTYYKRYYHFLELAEKEPDDLLKQNLKTKADEQLTYAENDLRITAQTYFQTTGSEKDGGFWTKACRNLFMSVALAVAEQVLKNKEETIKVNPYTIYDVANEMINEKISKENHEYLKKIAGDPRRLRKLVDKYAGNSVLDVFFREAPRTHPGRKYYSAILASAPAKTTLGNILTHFNGDLESFLQTANAKMTSWDDGFDIEDIGFDPDKPTAVFVMFSDSDELNNRLGMLIIDQIYRILKSRADLQDSAEHAHCVRPVIQIFEEAGNLGVPIPNLSRKWTAGLSRWLYSCVVLQDIEQLTQMYSKAVRDTILGNIANFVYIRTGSEDTNEYIAKQLGKRQVYTKSRTKDPTSLSATETENLERIEMLAPAELRRLRAGESVILRLNHEEDKAGEVIYQYPIYNTFENDTNMIKFDAFRKKNDLSWEEIPVNNTFMGMDVEDLLMTLEPIQLIPVEKDPPPVEERPEAPAGKSMPKNFSQQMSLFDSTVDLACKNLNGSLLRIDEVPPYDEASETAEKHQKKELLDLYLEVIGGELERPIDQVFSSNQLRQLHGMIRKQFRQKAQCMNEYSQIVQIQNQNLASLLSFLVANGDRKFNLECIDSLKKWKEGADAPIQ